MAPAQLGAVLRAAGLWRRLPPPWSHPVVANDPPGTAPWRRALAATGSPAAADALAAVWPDLTRDERSAVRDPVRLGADARQATERTCGPAVLTMLAALGDPLLALWLATGRVLPGAVPAELAGASPGALRALARNGAAARCAALHAVTHRRATRTAVAGVLPWPRALGTPPWAVASGARFLGVGYVHAVVDDADRGHLEAALARVRAAVDAGIPVPLFTGGDASRGWRAAVPRHVVLAVGTVGDGLRIWEPARGAVLTARREVLAGGRPHAALGGWRHVAWAVLPGRLAPAAGADKDGGDARPAGPDEEALR